jgi:dolichol kinase
MDFKKESIRKSLHLPGLFFLFLGKHHPLLSMGLLATLILLYLMSLGIRNRGGRGIPLVSDLTERLQRDEGNDWGPPLLALGILLAITFFDFQAAACAVFQICVADGAASLAGQRWGTRKLFYSPRKSYWGSFAFFTAAFFCQLFLVPLKVNLLLAAAGTLIESLSPDPWDNLLVPAGVALFAKYLL